MALDINAKFEVTPSQNDTFYVYTTKEGEIQINNVELKNILVINSEFMGQDHQLGETLMQACIHTLCDIDIIPEKIILYNSGVKLLTKNEQITNDLKSLKNLGVEIIACGACIEHYSINSDIARITNMYDILQTTTKATKVMYL